jgi:hypothetical protein
VLGVRHQGVINGFILFDAMRETLSARAAMAQAIAVSRAALHER